MSGASNAEKSKQTVCTYFTEAALERSPEDTLQLFRHVFIEFTEHDSAIELSCSVINMLLSDKKQEFQYTLKRVCYILIQTWWKKKEHQIVEQLIQQFDDPLLERPSLSKAMQRLREWIKEFKTSQTFQDLKLYTSHAPESPKIQDCYKAYLLSHHYLDEQNPSEQRQLAKVIAYDLKMAFRYKLIQFKTHQRLKEIGMLAPKNPTRLNETALFIIIKKALIHRKNNLSQPLVDKFKTTSEGKTFAAFKNALNQHLVRSLTYAPDETLFDYSPIATLFQSEVTPKLIDLFSELDNESTHDILATQTGKRLIGMLTNQDHEKPTPLFCMFLWGNSSLDLVLLLQTISVLCPDVQNYIDSCIGHLALYCQGRAPKEQQALQKFLEIYRVVFSINGASEHHDIVKIANPSSSQSRPETARFTSYIQEPKIESKASSESKVKAGIPA